MSDRKFSTMSEIVLRIDGEVSQPLALTFDDLAAIPAAQQVADVSQFHPQRQGDAVTLEALLAKARLRPAASYLTLHATTDDFHASVPLPAKNGGPIRFLIRNPAACHTDELDDCANVKFVDRIELTAGKGRDNRPHDDVAHEKLHGG